jgi:hypothetical protein
MWIFQKSALRNPHPSQLWIELCLIYPPYLPDISCGIKTPGG